MFSRKVVIAALLFAGGASIAIACGPYFPWQLLDDRTTTLRATPHNSFAFEVAHLVPTPRDPLKPVEPAYFGALATSPSDFITIEAQGLTQADGERIQDLRMLDDSDRAYAQGEGLPEAVRLYTAGAVAFHANDFDRAAKRFAAVLALPPQRQRLRATWAAFMAGRIAALAGNDGEAIAMFALTRRLALDGAPDQLGLAVASFGEEARLSYNRANGELGGDTAPPAADSSGAIPADPYLASAGLPAEHAKSYRDAMTAAAVLYAEQAAHGSDSGVQSLRMIAENILTNADRIDAAVPSPLLERLLVVYALARLDDTPAHDQGTNDAGTREPGVTLNPLLIPLVDAILKGGGPNPPGADRLAALCYRIGRYDLAARLAGKAQTPLAEWVKAKIALQRGDLAAAARHYASASRGFPATGNSQILDADKSNRVVGEEGVLQLARGEYVDALDKLYPVAATYWGDVAYIAERVLTTDELKDFVDAKVPLTARAKASSDYSLGTTADPAAQLRNLLARRLMRDGRYAAAISYFGDAKLRGEAVAYALALHEANTDWSHVERARAFFAAAKLAREQGIDLLGTEAAPDFYNLDGDYDVGIGQDKPSGPYVTKSEQLRAAASVPNPDLRFHYRYIAVDEASAAANLLPRRSQAFAAALCWADDWMMQTSGNEARVRAIYRRYVAEGPHVPWAEHFGRNCPAPDFDRAAALERRELYFSWRHYASRHRWWLLGLATVAVAALSFLTLYFVAMRPGGDKDTPRSQ